jgi:SAM-dependent methyltransferase
MRQFGAIDIYLFDQLLRGRITRGMKVLDTGCGAGRNVQYLMEAGIEVFGVDQDPESIDAVRALAAKLAPQLPARNFRAEPVEAMTFPDEFADFVISSAVLHFARNEDHFWEMLRNTWRVLRPAGLLFCRLASTIGCENDVRPLKDRRFVLPDGTERLLVDESLLMHATERLGGDFADPLKTTVVRNQRSMTTWVVRRLP